MGLYVKSLRSSHIARWDGVSGIQTILLGSRVFCSLCAHLLWRPGPQFLTFVLICIGFFSLLHSLICSLYRRNSRGKFWRHAHGGLVLLHYGTGLNRPGAQNLSYQPTIQVDTSEAISVPESTLFYKDLEKFLVGILAPISAICHEVLTREKLIWLLGL